MQNLNRDWHQVLLIDTSGNPHDALASGRVYPAGTYYISVEQGSATASAQYNMYVNTVRERPRCQIQLDSSIRSYGFGYMSDYGGMGVDVNGEDYYYQAGYHNAYNDYKEAPLYLGGANNALNVNAPNGYVRAYVDFNQDGNAPMRSDCLRCFVPYSDYFTSYGIARSL